MARRLEFDYTTALDQATRLFWKTGYANTSLRDLLHGMGIGESSFYNTLKSKKFAYLESLKHYDATVNLPRGVALFSAPTAALGVRALFATVLDCLDDPDTPSRVCLLAASLTTEVLEEPDLRAFVEAQMAAIAEGFNQRLATDKERGLLPAHFEPQLVVPILITYLQGLWRMALLSYYRPDCERQIDTFLTALGL